MTPIDRLRLRLGGFDALYLMAIMGLLCGLLAGLAIVLFRLFIESGIVLWHTDHKGASDFETMDWHIRMVLPMVGGLVVGLLLQQLQKQTRQVGVSHVLERLAYHQGYMSWKNAVVQFLLGGLTIASGQSVGREGPGIHLGSASGSLLGQKMRLPNNSIRVLVACGAAAAISASFNTPLAGVIFAMEVVVMEYTTASFVPVILSSVSAALVSRVFFGAEHSFNVPHYNIQSLWEMPYFILMGLLAGCIASVFIVGTRKVTEASAKWSIWVKTTMAGTFVGLLSFIVPEVMGIGYDTVNDALEGNLALKVLGLCVLGKLAATIVCSGLSLPGGTIGPSIFIGATFGGTMGVLGAMAAPDYASYEGFYAMIGMATMMGAVLQAPLAALMALLELTNNPNVIFPGMLAVIVATLVVSQVFKLPSIFQSQMRARGLDLSVSPLTQILRRVGVAGVMERKVATLPRYLSREAAREELEKAPRWILIEEEEGIKALMEASDLARYMAESETTEEQESSEEVAPETDGEVEDLDLIAMPAQRLELTSVILQATLEEALNAMQSKNTSAAYVYRTLPTGQPRIYGVITREMINAHYTVSK